MAYIKGPLTRKNGTRFFEISVSRGHGNSPFVTRWDIPDGLAAKTIRSRVNAYAFQFEQDCHEGKILTRQQKKDIEKQTKYQTEESKTFKGFCTNVFMPDIAARCSENTRYNYERQLNMRLYPVFGGGKPYNESQCKWAGFCNGEVDIKTNHANDDVSATDAVLEKVHAKCPDAGTPDADQDNASDINTNGFSMCVAGRIDVNDLCNLLKLNIGSKYGTLTITFEAA